MQGVGEPEQLVVQDVPEPEAGESQAVVEVRAAGINFADVLIRRGMYPQMPEFPAVLGSEIAGELDGERVMASFAARAAATPSASRSTRAGSSRFRPRRASPKGLLFRWPSSRRGSR